MRTRFQVSRGVGLLIVVTVAVFVLDWLTGSSLTYWGAKSAAIWSGEVYRLVTATFLHGGLTHIFFNIYALYIFGQLTERILGTGRFIVLYIVSGAVGYIASLLVAPGQLAVGASAAIFGLMGYTLHFRLRRLPLRWSEIDAAFLQIFVLNALAAVLVPNIDQWAHLGGLIGGILCGSLLGLDPAPRYQRTVRPRETAMAAILCALILFVGLRPVTAANIVQRFVPALGERLAQRYVPYFLPYQVFSPVILWNYMDGGGDWVQAGEVIRVSPDRPVSLALVWWWERGGSFSPDAVHSYTVEWKHDGRVVVSSSGHVQPQDVRRDYGQVVVTPVDLGARAAGTWDVRLTMMDTDLVRLKVRVEIR